MISQTRFWRFGLHFCLNCGSAFPEDGGLCEYCREDLWDWVHQESLYCHRQNGVTSWSLFEWIPGWQETLSRLILSLKGNETSALWRPYALEFWRRYLISGPPSQTKILVPSPSRNGGPDHAGAFALHLADLSSSPLYDCLSRSETDKAQKKRRRNERGRARFEWDEKFSLESFRAASQGKQVIFVDDIVTSGFTAKAAWKALGQPRDFAVWSLAQRSLPCGRPGDLL